MWLKREGALQRHIKVSTDSFITESGPIRIGDRVTSSSLSGVGMNPVREKSLQATEVAPEGVAFSNGVKATKDGYTVGIALESFDGENAATTAEVSPRPVGERLRNLPTSREEKPLTTNAQKKNKIGKTRCKKEKTPAELSNERAGCVFDTENKGNFSTSLEE